MCSIELTHLDKTSLYTIKLEVFFCNTHFSIAFVIHHKKQKHVILDVFLNSHENNFAWLQTGNKQFDS